MKLVKTGRPKNANQKKIKKRNCCQCGKKFIPRWAKSPQEYCSRDCVKVARKNSNVERKLWTDEEIGELEFLSNLSARQAGEILGRSMQSVQHMRTKLAKGWSPTKKPWSDSDLDFVRSTKNLTAIQVADHLARTPATVVQMRVLLSKREGISFNPGRTKDPFYVGKNRLLAKTCLGCGLLLDASWFSHEGNKPGRTDGRSARWRPRCIRCSQLYGDGKKYRANNANRLGDRSAKYYKKQQQLSKQVAERNYFPYLAADHIILRDSTLTHFEKAILLKRTVSGVRSVIKKYGYQSRIGKGDPLNGVWHIDNPNGRQPDA